MSGVPAVSRSPVVWSHLGNIRTNQLCAYIGTCSPACGSSLSPGGCCLPRCHRHGCSPRQCGKRTVGGEEKHREKYGSTQAEITTAHMLTVILNLELYLKGRSKRTWHSEKRFLTLEEKPHAAEGTSNGGIIIIKLLFLFCWNKWTSQSANEPASCRLA